MKPSWIKVVFWGCAGIPPAGAMIFGSEDGSTVSVALDGETDVTGEVATTMLGGTVKEVALSVPVGKILSGAVLVGAIIAGVSELPAEVAELPRAEPDPVVGVAPKSDVVTPDSVAVTDALMASVADAVADTEPTSVPDVTEVVADSPSDAVPVIAVVAGVGSVAVSDAVPEVGRPVSSTEPEVADSAPDTVSDVAEPDNEPLSLEIGITEDRLVVSGIGTTEVGMVDTPSLDAIDDNIEEASMPGVSELGTDEGSSEEATVAEERRLSPVSSTEEITSLEGNVGKIPTTVVDSIDVPTDVGMEASGVIVEDPRIVSRPAVIPEEPASDVAV